MVSIETFRQLALSLPEATEDPHFEKTSFRVKNKIFATYDAQHQRVTLKLSIPDQDIFSSADGSAISPVPNKWGQQGWTLVELKKVKKEVFLEALKSAYITVAPKQLGEQVKKLLKP